MLTPRQNVLIKNGTPHNMSEYPKYGLVVREMAGGEYVILDIGQELDIRVKTSDVIPLS